MIPVSCELSAMALHEPHIALAVDLAMGTLDDWVISHFRHKIENFKRFIIMITINPLEITGS
jgi:hypothetical protein